MVHLKFGPGPMRHTTRVASGPPLLVVTPKARMSSELNQNVGLSLSKCRVKIMKFKKS